VSFTLRWAGLYELTESDPRQLSLVLVASSRRQKTGIAGRAHDKERRLKPIIDFEFVENIRQMGLYGFFANEYFFADLFVCQPLCYQSQDFQLSSR
jgi:hypothetical protein